MKRIHKELFRYIKSIDKIQYNSNNIIIESNSKKYLYKNKTPQEIIKYLESINYKKYYRKVNSEESFDLCEINDYYLDKNPIIELYKKSIEESEIEEDLYNKIYRLLSYRYDYLFQYYMKLQDKIEEELTPSRNHYNLLINMTNIYQLLSIGRFFLEEYYSNNNRDLKKSLWIDNITEKNILNGKIIEINTIKKDYLVFELANYYQYYYKEHSLKELVNELELTTNEKELLYSLIAISNINIEEFTLEYLKYNNITQSYLLEEYKKYQKRKDNMLQEEQKDI